MYWFSDLLNTEESCCCSAIVSLQTGKTVTMQVLAFLLRLLPLKLPCKPSTVLDTIIAWFYTIPLVTISIATSSFKLVPLLGAH